MKLIDKLPYFYEECPVTNTIQDGLESEANTLYRKVEDTRKQLYVSSATWGLELWEKFAGVKNVSGSLQDRRLKVIAKLTAKRTTTLEAMKELCKSYINDIEVTEIAREYRIMLNLIEKKEGSLPKIYNVGDMDSAIWEIKPAHLMHELNFKHSRKIQINTNYSDVKFKYIPCNCAYAGEFQPNTYNKDSELVALLPSEDIRHLQTSMLGKAIVGFSVLGTEG